MSLLLLRGSASHLPLASEGVQCVVTSPPYWGLRQYAGEQREVWGGDPEHAHDFSIAHVEKQSYYKGKTKWQHVAADAQENGTSVRDVVPEAWGHPEVSKGDSCECGAWYGALGLEPTPELYVEHMVAIFREVRRVLRKDGTLWLNLGDSYAANWSSMRPQGGGGFKDMERERTKYPPPGMKPKDLCGIPWMVAFALRADGWYLRSDIIWAKPNPMPESVTDRPTKAHEYLFLLSKSERYYYDADAIREPVQQSSLDRIAQNGGHPTFDGARERRANGHITGRDTLNPAQLVPENGRNRRTVWEIPESEFDQFLAWKAAQPVKPDWWRIATRPYPGAHFATYPEDLVEPCILAGSRAGDVVLDPFNGSGTTGRVAVRHGRNYVGLDISDEYLRVQSRARIDNIQHVMGGLGV